MKVTFLGTAGSILTAEKSFPSILIDEIMLLDCGEGTTQKLIQINSIDTLKSICLTHLHADHFMGLFSLLWHYILTQRKNDLTIYGPLNSKETVEKIFVLTNFPGGLNALPFKIHFRELINSSDIQEIHGEYKIKYVGMDHPIPAFAYRIENNGKSICYSGDTKFTQKLIKLAEKSNIFICESTFPDKYAKFAEDYGHCTPSDAAKMARNADCKKLVMVHISPFFKEEIPINDMQKIFNKEILVAHDFMTLEILP
ncbi:hypothetical protein LCGC14_0688460 [marine sediment metagenome]|uniref:Metallo-beta-lactamase domain-containing protein n=1 Tax=marine sediment metagenome TaxID=412755 RepID=A0A0F9T7E6_9ZZZZ|nr:MBL fold metallo-hydrolase [bacterium]